MGSVFVILFGELCCLSVHVFVVLPNFCDRTGHVILWGLPSFDKDSQMCDSQVLIPSLRPTETQIISLSSLRPMELIGDACNQSLEYGDAAASNLALSLTSDALPKILAWILEAIGPSHAY